MGTSGERASTVDEFVGDRRQYILATIDEHDRTVTIDELADAVVEWEEQRGLNSDWADAHEHLYDVDLPVLEEADLLVFDENEGVVDQRHAIVDGYTPEHEGEVDGEGASWRSTLLVAVPLLAGLPVTATLAATGAATPAVVAAGGTLLAFIAALAVRWFA